MATRQPTLGELQNLNFQARAAVLGSAVQRRQQIFTTTIATPGSNNNVVNVPPRNVGLIKGFWVKVSGTITNTAAAAGAITPAVPFGAANIVSQFVFTDLQNNTRINTTGWHMEMLATARGRRPWRSAYTQSIATPAYGNNYASGIAVATASIAQNGGTGTVTEWYYVPLAYSDLDLRGAVFANVVNATMNLQITLNPSPVVDNTVDPMNAIYSGGAGVAGTLTAVTVTVYQEYLDQIPIGKGGPILPPLDLSTVYEIKNTLLTGLAQSNDFPIPYSNFRDFLSTIVAYSNGGAYNAGTDINYWALQSANYVNIFQIDPFLASLLTRQELNDDLPSGVYYFNFRTRPISTVQYGNMQLLLNPSSVGATLGGSKVAVGFESFAMINTITGAGSLAAG